MTKDVDFVDLLDQHGAPPQVILVTCGNTSNSRLRHLAPRFGQIRHLVVALVVT